MIEWIVIFHQVIIFLTLGIMVITYQKHTLVAYICTYFIMDLHFLAITLLPFYFQK